MAMAVTPRFGSVRQKSRTPVRRPSFRDDMNLVAIRYEKTSRGEAPIPVTTVNPIRTTSRPTSSASSSPSHTSPSPIVILPPPGSLPHPTEEHPALRAGPVLPRTASLDEWKRDSGHAPASSSSTPTINEEACEDDFSPHSPRVRKLVAAAHAVQPETVSSRSESIQEEDRDTHRCSDRHSRGSMDAAEASDQWRPVRSPATAMSDAGAVPVSGLRRPSSSASLAAQQARPRSATQLSTSKKKLSKSFSLRSVSSLLGASVELGHKKVNNNTLRRSGLSPTSSCGSMAGPSAPMQPLMRGSPAPATDTEPIRGHQPPSSRAHNPPSATSPPWRWGLFSPKSPSHSRRDIHHDADATIFSPLSVSLPSEGLLDDEFIAGLSFSKRGSVMFGGKRALSLDGAIMDTQQPQPDDRSRPSLDKESKKTSNSAVNLPATATQASESILPSASLPKDETPDTDHVAPEAVSQTQAHAPEAAQPTSQPPSHEPKPESQSQQQQHLSPTPNIRVMAADVERDSQKVRSLYSAGEAIRWEDGASLSLGERTQSPIEEVSADDEKHDPPPARLTPSANTPKSADSSSLRPNSFHMKETEAAGGLEDWDDLDGAIVDRYGFITAPSRPGSSRLGTPTETKSAMGSPRKRNVLQKRDGAGSSPLSGRRPPSRKVSARSLNTQHSGVSATSFRSHRSVVRQAGNLLPYNRDRRWMDEAGDMLTVSPSLQDITEEARVEKISEALKRKEWERSEKWRKMAKNINKGAQGGGMEFEFDVKNPKLIERTWKGIPDCWRSAAWWSFLEVSAKNHPGSPTTEEIIADFHRLQEKSSPDDVQIDLDVPRTISRHIMFRRRYQGGQRLLFRVLHALSIYFPATGYVQGMAPLGATLLCYFDEEKCFAMLVRMWQLRGLERLYRHGFEGLMTGLREFESSWLNKDVADKLTELGIDPTAYGTRWYLTLFNLSIPFPAQLRVWDVFLLLGTSPSDHIAAKPSSKKSSNNHSKPSTGLDVLHAASAALIQALREVLLDSDFENAMKTLTSFIQIKDEDLLMKVTKAEWRAHQGKKKS